jgi:hypothetical protein
MYIFICFHAPVLTLASSQGKETMDVDVTIISSGPESEESTTPAEVCHLLI